MIMKFISWEIELETLVSDGANFCSCWSQSSVIYIAQVNASYVYLRIGYFSNSSIILHSFHNHKEP